MLLAWLISSLTGMNAAYRLPFRRNVSLVIEVLLYSRDIACVLREHGAGTVLAVPEFCH
jgi:hypothetical protein